MNDPIDQFLQTDFTGSDPSRVREAALAQTTRLLGRRRLKRRLAWAGALAACFIAGMATMMFLQSREPSQPQALAPQKEDLQARQPPKKASPITKQEAPLSVIDMEWRAFDARENRAALFFEVARRYLEEEKDYESALRCYRQALDASPKEDLAIRPEDNWFVMALKESRLKEKN